MYNESCEILPKLVAQAKPVIPQELLNKIILTMNTIAYTKLAMRKLLELKNCIMTGLITKDIVDTELAIDIGSKSFIDIER